MEMKEYVEIAFEAATSLFGSVSQSNIMLEEISFHSEKNHCEVTLGWDIPDAPRVTSPGPNIPTILGFSEKGTRRVYKVFTIDKKTKEIISIKIREL